MMRWIQYFVVELVQIVKFGNHIPIKSSVTHAGRQTLLYVETYEDSTLFFGRQWCQNQQVNFTPPARQRMSVGMYPKSENIVLT